MKWAAKDPPIELRRLHAQHRPDLYGPMVCVCQTPNADARKDAGMCQTCGRKPLALMRPRGEVRLRR